MKRVLLYSGVVLAAGLSLSALWSIVHAHVFAVPGRQSYRSSWSSVAAATYLDSRETWWQNWPTAQLDHGTFCLSCHTAVPYALARPALRRDLNQRALTTQESSLLKNVEARVSGWSEERPYYTDQAHAMSSHATEAILNAVILASYSAEDDSLKPIARRATDFAWALQIVSGKDAGGWQWQDFHEAPWEAPESAYQGAAMLALAVARYPDLNDHDDSTHRHIESLREYLVRQYPEQPILNQLYVLWTSSRFSDLLTGTQRANLLKRVAGLQKGDGGWSLSSLDSQTAPRRALLQWFKRASDSDVSDGCATGLTILIIEQAGVNSQDPMLKRGLAWLEAHQQQDGSWWASSINGFRNQYSEMGRFMSDAATGYAVLALEEARARHLNAFNPPKERTQASSLHPHPDLN
jgi:squalene-hopene/tetraprenyl-beta-curcumene cyclase